MFEILANRTTSALPLSIGTSLAFESVFHPRQAPYDKDRVVPVQVSINDYNEVWVNILTLMRNITTAVAKEYSAAITPEGLAETVLQEMDMLISILKEEATNGCNIMFYHDTYDKPTKSKILPPAVKFRVPNTTNQIAYADLVNKASKILLKLKRPDLKQMDGNVYSDNKPASVLIFTHIPWDLLSHTNTRSMHLIESHTGVLKTRQQWNSKYHPLGSVKPDMLPFTRKFLLIFGDTVMIKPMVIQFRELILDIAQKRNFTPLTTDSKIRFFLDSDIRERYLLEVYDRL